MVPEGMRRSADSFHPEKVPRTVTPRVEDLNNSEILREMLGQAIEKSGNNIPKEIIYKIVSDWTQKDKDELISSIRGPISGQEEMELVQLKFMQEAKADR